MAENVRVVVRCRPMSKGEHQMKCRNIVQIEDCSLLVQNPNDVNGLGKTFTYDNVYDALAPTEAIYNDLCYSLVDNVLDGYNGTIFAYGQTGCGKTHTMQGPDIDENDTSIAIPSSQRGIITRSFDHIFEAISVACGVHYLALVSYLEIYNENIRDLLSPNESIIPNHALKEIPGLGVTVPTLSTHTVHNAKECYRLLSEGNRNRMVGATLMNASSSRSHSIFSISLEQIHDDDVGVVANISGLRRGKLNLVDLAGSERQTKTGAVGERLKEAAKINLSLSALGNVISALVDGKTKHIPYRDSKLTRLLQDSLGGNTKTLMISCISPADYNYDETISTLRYASRAKSISNKPKINEDPKNAKLREYHDEILKLRKMLDESNFQSKITITENDEGAASNRLWLENERAKLQTEMEQQMEVLRQEHTKQQCEKDERMYEMEALHLSYAEQLKKLDTADALFNSDYPTKKRDRSTALQLEARERIEIIKRTLIGGERANDMKLKERRQKKKMDAQRRLSALAHVLSRVEQTEDRDLLQGHYTNIQQELIAKNEHLRANYQKIKALEREVSDLQVEFQMDRADYLESIRRLEQNLKFYHQIMDKALPILRKYGKYWDCDEILQNSTWNDDLKIWKLPDTSMDSFKLPNASKVLSNTNPQSIFASAMETVNNAKSNFADGNDSGTDDVLDSSSSDVFNEKNNGNDESNDNQMRKQRWLLIKDANIVTNMEKKPKNENDFNKSDILNNYFRSSRQKPAMEETPQRTGYSSWSGAKSKTPLI